MHTVLFSMNNRYQVDAAVSYLIHLISLFIWANICYNCSYPFISNDQKWELILFVSNPHAPESYQNVLGNLNAVRFNYSYGLTSNWQLWTVIPQQCVSHVQLKAIYSLACKINKSLMLGCLTFQSHRAKSFTGHKCQLCAS